MVLYVGFSGLTAARSMCPGHFAVSLRAFKEHPRFKMNEQLGTMPEQRCTPSLEASLTGGKTTEAKGPRTGSRESARTVAEDESGILGRLGSCLGSANCAVACSW